MPTISVIIPIYNVEKYISECLESIINQTFKDIEILCIDDCGRDNSIKIAQAYAKKDSRIKIIKHPSNKGLSAARNTGISHARGKYIAFIDSDDYAYPAFLEKAYDRIEKSKYESVWVCVKSFFENSQTFETDFYYEKLYRYAGGDLEITPENITNLPVVAHNKLFSLDFIRNNGLLFPEGLLYEDEEFFFKFYTKSKNVYLIREKLTVYRRRNNSIMGQTKKGLAKREDICAIAANIYEYLIKNGMFEEYKNSLLNFILTRIKYSLKEKAYRKRMIAAMREMIKKIDFPEKYEDDNSNAYCFLAAVSKYDPSKKVSNFLKRTVLRSLLLLINIIPFSKIRKKARTEAKKSFF